MELARKAAERGEDSIALKYYQQRYEMKMKQILLVYKPVSL